MSNQSLKKTNYEITAHSDVVNFLEKLKNKDKQLYN
jgi:hypothetical protein